MKKKNLIILLLIPFLVSVLTTVTINATYVYVDVDISDISWDYGDPEPFKLNEEGYLLNASGVNQRDYAVAEGNDLVWTVENKNGGESIAEIEKKSNGYYLKTLGEGTVIITCSNQKGNVSRKMEAVIYDKGYIIAQAAIKPSGGNIDSTIYYGRYDLDNGGNKKAAEISVSLTSVPEDLIKTVDSVCSDNVEYDKSTGTVKVKSAGEAKVTFISSDEEVKPYAFEFTVVEDGVNVYTYEQLLNCTNRSNDGEIVVLRKSFQSLSAYNSANNANNVELFGKMSSSGRFSFASDIYSFTTKANHEYIIAWNEFARNNSGYKEISDKINVGLRIKKDFYGNGYTINFHNLAYPYEKITTGDGQEVPTLTADNLFRGPLPFYTLGDPNGLPLVTAYGQDNVGFYVDGDNVTVNDVKIMNCDKVNSLKKLETVGTVVDVDGDGVTIKNSVLSNGKNVLRSFSSYGLVVDNCMISSAQNFLFTTGSNEYEKTNSNKSVSFSDEQGNSFTSSVFEYIRTEGKGDTLMDTYLGNISADKVGNVKSALLKMQNALNETDRVVGRFKGDTVLHNCQFSDSGIASIVFETLFNGPFLYSKVPSSITKMFSMITSGAEQKPLIPDPPENISGTSYPVKVTLSGDTAFYDYKDFANMDISGLINENISTILKELTGSGGLGGIFGDKDYSKYDINIDMIFPLKGMVKTEAQKRGLSYAYSNGAYTNISVAYYGGGANLSVIDCDEDYSYIGNVIFSNPAEVDMLETYLAMSSADNARQMYNMMLKMVTIVTGYEPFKFVFTDDVTLGQTPSVERMIAHAKGV